MAARRAGGKEHGRRAPAVREVGTGKKKISRYKTPNLC